MLEYYDENIWYKKKNRKKGKKFRKFLIIFIVIILLCFLVYHVKFNVTKNIFTYCEEYSKSKCAETINKSILFSFCDGVSYSDLVYIEKNSDNEITLISANTGQINKLSNTTVKLIKINLEKEFANGIPIPFMAFSGLKVFSGYGKSVNFKSINISQVNCEFDSNFLSAGINQTLHKISVNIKCTMSVNMFFDCKKIELEQNVLISETVLVGKIPNLYLNNGLFK